MIVSERKSKYKHKVIFTPSQIDNEHSDRIDWCTRTFGPGGRNKHLRWRFGWTDNSDTFYFRNPKDAAMFLLRWS